MSRWYRFMYGIGFKPWEMDSATVGPQLDGLLAVEEAGREPPFGSALDLGCGTGRWSVELARRGWQVVGVDVAALRNAGVGSGFSLFLDVECFNHLNDAQRAAVGREVNAVASPDATMLLLVWARARRGPLPPGAKAPGSPH